MTASVPLVLDLMCALCFVRYASAVFARGAACRATSEKLADGCPGKLIATEPRSATQPRRERRKREAVAAAADADDVAEAVAK